MKKKTQRILEALAKSGLNVAHKDSIFTVRGNDTPDAPGCEVLLPEHFPVEANAFEQLSAIASVKHPHGGIVAKCCATPDVHKGDAGIAIGTVVATEGMIIPSAVGDDINCFSGDTLVPLLDGTEKTIRCLAENNNPFYCFSITEEKKIVGAKATAFATRKVSSLLRITLDNDSSVDCTPDHFFMMRDGSYKKAEDLKEQDSLMPFNLSLDKDGYALIRQPYSGLNQRVHWAIARGGLLGPIPSFDDQRTVIHHIDFNKNNNVPENLKFMGSFDHQSYHSNLASHHIHFRNEEFEKKRIAAIKAKAASPAGAQFYSERASKRFKKYQTENKEVFKEAVKLNGIHGGKALSVYNKSEKARARSIAMHFKICICEVCDEGFIGIVSKSNHMKHKHGFNHKIKNIETISFDQEVYCLNVPQYENFAIAAGVFVHNCGMRFHTINLSLEKFLSKKQDFLKLMTGDYLLGTRDLPMSKASMNTMFACGLLGWIDSTKDSPLGQLRKTNFSQLMKDSENIWENGVLIGAPRWAPPGLINQDTVRDDGLGTIGSGNHFVEVQIIEEIIDRKAAFEWGIKKGEMSLMIHSGSRYVGKHIGRSWQEKLQCLWPAPHPYPKNHIFSLSANTQANHIDDYIEAENTASNYAFVNRMLLAEMFRYRLRAIFGDLEVPLIADIPHNITEEVDDNCWVTRKGASPAYDGQKLIIPGSMGTASYLCRGLGSERFLNSASHGAGRSKSRSDMSFNKDEIDNHTVECITLREERRIEEAPEAYKDIEAVIKVQTDKHMIVPVAKMKPILTFKA